MCGLPNGDGIWVEVFAVFTDTENPSINPTCVKVHESSNGVKKTENKAVGRTKGSLSANAPDGVRGFRAIRRGIPSKNNSTFDLHLWRVCKRNGASVLHFDIQCDGKILRLPQSPNGGF